MKPLMRYHAGHTQYGYIRMYLFKAVKMKLRVRTTVNNVNVNTHNVGCVNSTQNDFGEYRTVRACMIPDCTECVAVRIPHQTEARELLLEARAGAEINHISDHPSLVHAAAFADIDELHLYCNPALFQHSRPSRVVKRQLRHTETSPVSCVSVDDGHEMPIDTVEDLHIHTLNIIQLPPNVAVLYNDWDSEYAADPVPGPYCTILQADGVSGQYRLHMCRVRLAGRICVLLSLLE